MREEETKTKEALLILILAELFCARPKGDPLSSLVSDPLAYHANAK